MASAVFIMCALAAIACAGLLIRGWLVSRSRLLLWAALGFAGLAVNNIMLVIDRVLLPQRDLIWTRDVSGFLGVSVLLFGLIWEATDHR